MELQGLWEYDRKLILANASGKLICLVGTNDRLSPNTCTSGMISLLMKDLANAHATGSAPAIVDFSEFDVD